MAKFTMLIKNGAVKKTLVFKNESFNATMPREKNGRSKSNKPSLRTQVQEKFELEIDEVDLEMILEEVDKIDFGLEDEIIEALDELSGYEE